MIIMRKMKKGGKKKSYIFNVREYRRFLFFSQEENKKKGKIMSFEK